MHRNTVSLAPWSPPHGPDPAELTAWQTAAVTGSNSLPSILVVRVADERQGKSERMADCTYARQTGMLAFSSPNGRQGSVSDMSGEKPKKKAFYLSAGVLESNWMWLWAVTLIKLCLTRIIPNWITQNPGTGTIERQYQCMVVHLNNVLISSREPYFCFICKMFVDLRTFVPSSQDGYPVTSQIWMTTGTEESKMGSTLPFCCQYRSQCPSISLQDLSDPAEAAPKSTENHHQC
ncbi:hypothetical protein Anapl_12622 [Anas platyrhynchos]|uniref:Uncharacterized protein n=1 Tax=Anas platyrhynchos TaxID=8839 RepID=R0L956_ANAPL|nr:hypothetical protein Anapl_12622 [Anas platyrhynchos]